MQKGFFLILIAASTVKAQTTATTANPCKPADGETGDNNYAVLKRNCYSKYGEAYSPKFYPLTKGVHYKTSQATDTCGKELSIMFQGKTVCLSFTYEEYTWTRQGIVRTLSRCEQRCFTGSATIVERKNFPTYSYQADREIKSDLDLIITPNHNGVQPTAEPCYPPVGEAGSADIGLLKRAWCQKYTKKICFTITYPLVKGASFKTSQANRTYGRDVSVVFYGKEVCIAYIYERFDYRNGREILSNSYCKKTCFTGFKSNQKEKRESPADPFNPALEWESDYELIVTSGNVARSNFRMNVIIVLLFDIITMFISLWNLKRNVLLSL